MSKREEHVAALEPLLVAYMEHDDWESLVGYLVTNSNLPGPRGNLELGEAFARTAADLAKSHPEKMQGLIADLVAVDSSQASVNAPEEFLSFCGAWAAGTVGAAVPSMRQEALALLRRLAGDERWRVREAVANGIQALIEAHPAETIAALRQWTDGEEPLLLRAVVAGVAEPHLLRDIAVAGEALSLHKAVLRHFARARAEERRSEEFKALRQGLGYTLSVVVAALPQEGFAFLRELASSADKDVRWVVKENLKKNRLLKAYPEQVKAVAVLLEA